MDVYLQDAGIIMMTNANEEENGMIYYPVMARHASYENGEMFRGPPPAMAVMRHDAGAPMLMLSGRGPAPLEVRIRKDFYETFIWETFDIEDKEDAVQEEEEENQEENDIRIKKKDISEEEEQVTEETSTEETKQDVEESQTVANQEGEEENQTQGTTVVTETTKAVEKETQTQTTEEVKHLEETTAVTQEQSVVTEVTEPTTTKSPDQGIPKERFVIHGGSS